MPKVVLTDLFHPEKIKSLLSPHARVVVARSRSQLLKELKTANALITLLSDPVDQKLLANAPALKVVGNYAVGVNNIDLAACARKNVRVVNTPGVLTQATAELTLALLLACARRVPEGEALCRKGHFKGWAPDLLVGLKLQGRHAVLVGRGRIGEATGRLFDSMGILVSWIHHTTPAREVDQLLKQAQILSIHCPLTPETRHWLNRRRLALLPKDCIVLNTARGPVIDEKALIQTLKARKIFGAGLDVYENEPKIPAELRKLPNVVLLPHVGSATLETRADMAELVIEGVLSVLRGELPPNEVKLP